MIIDLNKSRAEYFRDLDHTAIVRSVTGDDGRFVTTTGLRRLAEEDSLIVGTAEGELEQILTHGTYSLDSLALAEKIDELEEGQLLVLPPEYRIPAVEARDAITYSDKTLINLDFVHVKRAILGADAKSGRLSGIKKQEHQWEPEKVIAAAFNHLHENRDKLAEKAFSCYGWRDKVGRLRVVPLMRAIQGAELRMFQNLAALKMLPPRMRTEVSRGIRFDDGSELSPEEVTTLVRKIERYEGAVRNRGLEAPVNALKVSGWDLMKPQGEAFNCGTAHYVRVPSLTRPTELFQGQKITRLAYSTTLLNVPLLERGDQAAYSSVWDLEGLCECKDFKYRSHRRKKSAHKGMPDIMFCKHLAGAAWDLMSIHKRKDDRTIPFIPFLLPTKTMSEYLDKLRYQAVILQPTEAGRWKKRALNHTEMERHLWDRVKVHGYEACFSTDTRKLVERGNDPLTYLIRFRE